MGSLFFMLYRLNDEGMIESDDDFEEYFGVEEDSQQLTGTHIILDDQVGLLDRRWSIHPLRRGIYSEK